MGAHATLEPMMDRAHLQFDRFERAEGALDVRERLVVLTASAADI